MSKKTLRSLALAGGLFLCPACNLVTEQSAGIRMVDDLVSQVESVQIEAQVAAQSVFGTLRSLHPLVAGKFNGDAVETYVAFVQAVEDSEKQAARFRQSVVPMAAAAERVFGRWESGLEQYQGESMRARSQARLEEARTTYGAVLEASNEAQGELDAFHAGMRDLVLFLGIDLNQSSVRAINDEAKALALAGQELRRTLERCSEAAGTYVGVAVPLGQIQVDVQSEE